MEIENFIKDLKKYLEECRKEQILLNVEVLKQ
jgi:hypothetical protein